MGTKSMSYILLILPTFCTASKEWGTCFAHCGQRIALSGFKKLFKLGKIRVGQNYMIVAPVNPSPHYPLPIPLWLLLDCS